MKYIDTKMDFDKLFLKEIVILDFVNTFRAPKFGLRRTPYVSEPWPWLKPVKQH